MSVVEAVGSYGVVVVAVDAGYDIAVEVVGMDLGFGTFAAVEDGETADGGDAGRGGSWRNHSVVIRRK